MLKNSIQSKKFGERMGYPDVLHHTNTPNILCISSVYLVDILSIWIRIIFSATFSGEMDVFPLYIFLKSGKKWTILGNTSIHCVYLPYIVAKSKCSQKWCNKMYIWRKYSGFPQYVLSIWCGGVRQGSQKVGNRNKIMEIHFLFWI